MAGVDLSVQGAFFIEPNLWPELDEEYEWHEQL